MATTNSTAAIAGEGFVHFRCDTTNDYNRSDLCLNGATCLVVPFTTNGSTTTTTAVMESMETCSCPSGFIHDFTAGHFVNCGMTDYALPIMFGVFSCAVLLALFFSIPIYLELKSSTKRISLLAITTTTFSWACFLSIWVQNGMFEPAIIFLFLRNVVNFRCLVDLSLVFTAPVNAMQTNTLLKFKRRVLILESVNFCGQLMITISLLVFVREANPSRYNSAIVLLFAFFATMSVVISSTILKQVLLLRKSILTSSKAIQETPKIKSFLARLASIQRMNVSLIIVFVLIFVFPIAISLLGSFPGQNVVVFFMFLFIPSFTVRGAFLLRVQHGDLLTAGGGGGASILTAVDNPGFIVVAEDAGSINGAGDSANSKQHGHPSSATSLKTKVALKDQQQQYKGKIIAASSIIRAADNQINAATLLDDRSTTNAASSHNPIASALLEEARSMNGRNKSDRMSLVEQHQQTSHSSGNLMDGF